MSADSADQVSTSDQTERLAQIIDEIETDGTEVVDFDTHIQYEGTLEATIELAINEGRLPESGSPRFMLEWDETDLDAEEIVGELENGELHEVRHGNEPEPVGEEGRCSAAHGQLDAGEECPYCDHVAPLPDAAESDDDAGEENRGQASISSSCNGSESDKEDEDKSEHQPADDLQEALDNAGVETDEEPDSDSAAGAVLATLREEGELAGKELKLVSGVSNIYSVVSELHDDGLVAKRRDPDDGRRTLYRPAEMDVDDDADDQDDAPEWNGRDPETIVADSSLPARVVLEDILNAVADASTVIEAAETLDVDVDNLESVCWHLTLKQPDSLEIVDDIEDRIKTVQEVADVE